MKKWVPVVIMVMVAMWWQYGRGENKSMDEAKFVSMVANHFKVTGQEIETGDGWVKTKDGKQYGLLNLWQSCATQTVDVCRELIGEHFEKIVVVERENEEMAAKKDDWDYAKDKLRVKLYPNGHVDNGNVAKQLLRRTGAIPNIEVDVVWDMAEASKLLFRKEVEKWNKTEEEIWLVAMENTLRKNAVNTSKETIEGYEMTIISTEDNYYTTSWILSYETIRECHSRNGSLVGIPKRDLMICYPLSREPEEKLLETMERIVVGAENEGPGSISNRLYRYKNGRFEVVR